MASSGSGWKILMRISSKCWSSWKGPFLVLHFCCSILMTSLMMFSVNIAIFVDDTTLYSDCDQASDLWKQLNWLLNLNLICETLWSGVRSGLLISMVGKLNWYHLTGLMTMVLLMWKWMVLFLSKNHILRCWDWPSLLKLIVALTLSLLLKLLLRKLEF